MNPTEMEALFRSHREAEARRDYDAVIATFSADCYLETVALGLRSQGRAAARAAYVGYFTAFPDLCPEDAGAAFGEDVLVTWGQLRGTSGGPWLGVPPSGESFAVPFTNVTTFTANAMAGESIYFDLGTLCEQARLPIDEVRRAAKGHAGDASAIGPRSKRHRSTTASISPRSATLPIAPASSSCSSLAAPQNPENDAYPATMMRCP